MITVKIFINKDCIHEVSAVNRGYTGHNDECEYEILHPNTEPIFHRRRDGAIPLAIEMLKALPQERYNELKEFYKIVQEWNDK